MAQLTLSSILGTAAPRSLLIDGRSVSVRRLTLADDLLMDILLPPPTPPMIKDPNAGSLAPKVPDQNDPKYRRERAAWFSSRLAVEAAIALGAASDDGEEWNVDAPEEANRSWIEKIKVGMRAQPQTLLERIVAEARRDDENPRKTVEALIQDLGAQPVGSGAMRIPENYATTKLFAMLSVCERFGMDPARGLRELAALDPGALDILFTYDAIRRSEDQAVAVRSMG